MKPLSPSLLSSILERFDDFKEAQIQSISIHSARKIEVLLMVQDKLRGYDWIEIALEFYDVIDAKLLPEEKLAYIDSEDGFLLYYDYEDKKYVFSCEKQKSVVGTQNALCYIIAKSIILKEGIQ